MGVNLSIEARVRALELLAAAGLNFLSADERKRLMAVAFVTAMGEDGPGPILGSLCRLNQAAEQPPPSDYHRTQNEGAGDQQK